jgi:hypothetical protein
MYREHTEVAVSLKPVMVEHFAMSFCPVVADRLEAFVKASRSANDMKHKI